MDSDLNLVYLMPVAALLAMGRAGWRYRSEPQRCLTPLFPSSILSASFCVHWAERLLRGGVELPLVFLAAFPALGHSSSVACRTQHGGRRENKKIIYHGTLACLASRMHSRSSARPDAPREVSTDD